MRPVGKILLLTAGAGCHYRSGVFTYYYVKYSRLIEAKLAAGPFANTSMLFAAPRTVDGGGCRRSAGDRHRAAAQRL